MTFKFPLMTRNNGVTVSGLCDRVELTSAHFIAISLSLQVLLWTAKDGQLGIHLMASTNVERNSLHRTTARQVISWSSHPLPAFRSSLSNEEQMPVSSNETAGHHIEKGTRTPQSSRLSSKHLFFRLLVGSYAYISRLFPARFALSMSRRVAMVFVQRHRIFISEGLWIAT
jgi:hypothetical protein